MDIKPGILLTLCLFGALLGGTAACEGAAPTAATQSTPASGAALRPTQAPGTVSRQPTLPQALLTPTALNDQASPTTAQAGATAAPAATGTNNSATPPASAVLQLSLQPLIQNLKRPVYVTGAGDGTNRLFIVEQAGRILVVENGKLRDQPFLDIRPLVNTGGNEQGLLGLAFHPQFKTNGLFYVNYSNLPNGDNVIARYHVSSDPNLADPNSAATLLTVPGYEPNHNGGMLAFGPDRYLYIGTGDGGGAGDQHGSIGNGQALNSLNGKLLRIDVNGDPYRVPDNNPFVGQPDVKPEIWAYGLRNPWRFSFDRATGDLYIADVGQNSKEEVDFQPASSKGGENYGWRIWEGDSCFDPSQNCDRAGLVKPVAVFTHDFGCSITGGYVYRGRNYPALTGQYLFADYCSGIVWTMSRAANGSWQTRQVTKFDDTFSSFGEDDQGELYMVGHGSGTIYQLTASQ